MTNCKYIKKKINGEIWCIYNKERILRNSCSNCEHREYIDHTSSIKKVTKNKNIAKLEKNRFSILTNDLTRCIVCGKKKDHLHEVYPGRNRSNSMKYGCVIPLCEEHHREIHENRTLTKHYQVLTQQRFIKVYPCLDFIEIFRKNYL